MKSLSKRTPDSGPEITADRNGSVCRAKLAQVSMLLANVAPFSGRWGSQTREIWLLNYPGKARSEPFCNRFSTSIFLDMTYTDRRNPNHPCICRATDPHFLTFLLLFLDPWGAPVMLSVHTFSSKINWIYFSDKLATHSWAKEALLWASPNIFSDLLHCMTDSRSIHVSTNDTI